MRKSQPMYNNFNGSFNLSKQCERGFRAPRHALLDDSEIRQKIGVGGVSLFSLRGLPGQGPLAAPPATPCSRALPRLRPVLRPAGPVASLSGLGVGRTARYRGGAHGKGEASIIRAYFSEHPVAKCEKSAPKIKERVRRAG